MKARPQASATILVGDEKVRITRFDFEPGAQTGWHIHGHDYVITPVTQCSMVLEEPNGQIREVKMEAGDAYRHEKDVEHNVINNANTPMSFVEVELK